MVRIERASTYADGKTDMSIALTSTDAKPTDGVATGSVCVEVDSGDKYVFDEDAAKWTRITS